MKNNMKYDIPVQKLQHPQTVFQCFERWKLINTVTPGTTIVFKEIIAVGPDGTQRGLDPIVLSAN